MPFKYAPEGITHHAHDGCNDGKGHTNIVSQPDDGEQLLRVKNTCGHMVEVTLKGVTPVTVECDICAHSPK